MYSLTIHFLTLENHIENALNQPERGDLLATAHSDERGETPSNNSLKFTHKPKRGESPSNSPLRCKHT